MVERVRGQVELPAFPRETQIAIEQAWKPKRDALVANLSTDNPELVAAIDDIAQKYLLAYRQAWQAEKAIQAQQTKYSAYRNSDAYQALCLDEQEQFNSVHGATISALMEQKNRCGIEAQNFQNVQRLMAGGHGLSQKEAITTLDKIIGGTVASHNSHVEEGMRMRVTGKRRLWTELAELSGQQRQRQ